MSKPATYLAIDLGDKRTGLATGDDETGLASPLRTIEIPSKDTDRLTGEIRKAIESAGANALVIGIPFDMHTGDAGPQAKKCLAFATHLREATGLDVHEVDERLTSAEADWQMAGSGLTHKQKKARRDSLAAANILRAFLNDDPRAYDNE